MTNEIDVYGVFIHGALAALIVAALLHQLVRWALGRVGAYAFLWHPGLADMAIFLVIWALWVWIWRP